MNREEGRGGEGRRSGTVIFLRSGLARKSIASCSEEEMAAEFGLQGISIRPFPGSENAAGKWKQKR